MVIRENNIEEGYVVGDRSSDIKAAFDNKLTSIGVRFDFSQENELEKADYIADHITDIKKIINVLFARNFTIED